MQVSMSLTQETVDKLDALEKKIGATSRSDAVRLLVTLANEPRKGLIGIDDLSERLTTIQAKLDTLVEGMTRLLEAPRSTPARRINTVESTKKAVEPLTDYKTHKTYFKKALT